MTLICGRKSKQNRRSREGARIEIDEIENTVSPSNSRSREGASIETRAFKISSELATVAPARERLLLVLSLRQQLQPLPVAPARERGLK